MKLFPFLAFLGHNDIFFNKNVINLLKLDRFNKTNQFLLKFLQLNTIALNVKINPFNLLIHLMLKVNIKSHVILSIKEK